MKTMIAGSRSLWSLELLNHLVGNSPYDVTEVLDGGAKGADAVGLAFAIVNGLPVHPFPADWNRFGRAAGAIRNIEMVKEAEAFIIMWDGKSTGTAHSIRLVKELGLPGIIYNDQTGDMRVVCGRKIRMKRG